MHRHSFVYILASKRNGTLYIGSTTNLQQRIWQHKNNVFQGFTAKYRIHSLVYYEEQSTIIEAIHRESQLKGWCRKRKLSLIESFNPEWRDMYLEIY